MRTKGWGLLIGAATLTVGAATAQPKTPRVNVPAQFAVIDLGVLGSDPLSSATAVNDAGQVVGYSGNDPGAHHPFVWANGEMTPLGDLGGGTATAYGINNGGVVVGSGQIAGAARTHAFRWTPSEPNGAAGSLQDLGLLPGGLQAEAMAINDDGLITGDAATPVFGSPGSAAVYSGGQWSLIDGQVNPAPTGGVGWAINASGEVTGSLLYGFSFRAFIYTPTQGLVDLSHLFQSDSYARGMNDAGVVVGQSGNGGFAHAFVWRPDAPHGVTSAVTTLPSVGQSAAAFAINASGWIVGASDPYFGGEKATLWVNDAAIDLNTKLPPNSGWTLKYAYGVNSDGWIVGQGVHNGETRAFLLAPPEVASFTGRIGKGAASSTLAVPGNKAVRGMVTLLPAAPASGAHVTFSSDNPSVAPAPKALTIKAGAFSPKKPFKIIHKKVSQPTTVHLTATYNGGSRVLTLNLTP